MLFVQRIDLHCGMPRTLATRELTRGVSGTDIGGIQAGGRHSKVGGIYRLARSRYLYRSHELGEPALIWIKR